MATADRAARLVGGEPGEVVFGDVTVAEATAAAEARRESTRSEWAAGDTFADAPPPAVTRAGPQPAKGGDVALAGPDGAAARDLLAGALAHGRAVLGKPSAGR